MPFISVVLGMTAAFVLLVPIAMVAILVMNGMPARRAVRVTADASVQPARPDLR
ncbi:hypothetical protein ACFP3Q_17725 [Nocardioides sp. GCM10027113]|uniref:hypothetical protein n=1 Tax=unclassified Nocardioides TaxID=2615069 RepID=UPI003619174C